MAANLLLRQTVAETDRRTDTVPLHRSCCILCDQCGYGMQCHVWSWCHCDSSVMVAVDSNLQRTPCSNKRCMWMHSCPAHCSRLSNTSQPTSANSDGSLLDVIVTIRPVLSYCIIHNLCLQYGWLGSWVVSVLDSGAEGPGFKSQPWQS